MILTTAIINALTKPGRYRYGNGIYLMVSKGGTKSWTLRMSVNGKRRETGLGPWPKVSIGQAVRKADVLQQTIQATGRIPPRDRRRAGYTFQEVADEVYDEYRPTWKSDKHARNWSQSMRDYVYPHIGDQQIDSIKTKQLLDLLKPIWNTKPETARRVRQRLRRVFDWAVDYEYSHTNPAASLKSLPKNTNGKQHFEFLPYNDIQAFLKDLNESTGSDSVKLAIRFLILCASRSSEVRLADWREVDMSNSEWRIPAERMKAGVEHRVPLSAAGMDVLAAAGPSYQGLIFPSPRWPDTPMSDMSLTRLVRRMGYSITIHGFRSSFKTWAMEQTDTPWAVGEAALAHSLGDSTVQAYAQSDLFERRRRLMEEWGEFVTGAKAR